MERTSSAYKTYCFVLMGKLGRWTASAKTSAGCSTALDGAGGDPGHQLRSRAKYVTHVMAAGAQARGLQVCSWRRRAPAGSELECDGFGTVYAGRQEMKMNPLDLPCHCLVRTAGRASATGLL